MIRLLAAGLSSLLIAAVSPASLQFTDGRSTFAINGTYVPSVHYVGIFIQQGRVQVDADWSEAQVISRLLAGRGARKNVSVVMYDHAGAPHKVKMFDCVASQTPVQIPFNVPAASPFPSGVAKIIFHPTPAQQTHVILHCKRIVT